MLIARPVNGWRILAFIQSLPLSLFRDLRQECQHSGNLLHPGFNDESAFVSLTSYLHLEPQQSHCLASFTFKSVR